jgi:hypothetical protein
VLAERGSEGPSVHCSKQSWYRSNTGEDVRAYIGNLIRVLLSRREIVSQRTLGLKIEGFAKLGEILNQETRVHLLKMFLS